MNTALRTPSKFQQGQVYFAVGHHQDSQHIRLFVIDKFSKNGKLVNIKYNERAPWLLECDGFANNVRMNKLKCIKKENNIEYIDFAFDSTRNFKTLPHRVWSYQRADIDGKLSNVVLEKVKKIGISDWIPHQINDRKQIEKVFDVATCPICNINNIDICDYGSYHLLDPECEAAVFMDNSLGGDDRSTAFMHLDCYIRAQKVITTDIERERYCRRALMMGERNSHYDGRTGEEFDSVYDKCLDVKYVTTGIKICDIPERNEPTPEFVCDDNKCCICLDELTQANSCVTRCGHKLHMCCLMNYQSARKNQNPPCPICRGEMV